MIDYLKIEYPYYRLGYIYNKKQYMDALKKMSINIHNNFRNNSKKLEKYNSNKYFIIEDKWHDNLEINNLTDYFSEHIRITCRFLNKMSPKEYWDRNKRFIIQKTLTDLTLDNVREQVYSSMIHNNIRLCNNFRISLCLIVLNYFKPTTWLDISAGWGDRLISAILYKIKLYVATDPNLDLHPCYTNIINTLATPAKRKNYIIYKNGFLEATLPNKKFDIVFSSPPFFDLEKYSTFEENSLKLGSTEQEWCENFLVKSIIKAASYIKSKGHMLLYMDGSHYTLRRMHEELNKIMKNKGVIYYKDGKYREIYVWQKE